MTYPFVPAAARYGPRLGPALAFVIHMAEGGGTVAYLAGDPARGVSVHYVIEYTGRIVQMVRETDATGSINPRQLRDGDDPNGFYGETAARACLGGWYSDPNAATITCEIEGFARFGPNVDQRSALMVLVDDVRTRFPRIGLLGHRDFQDYKPCPGRLIPWDQLGGHGPASEDVDVESTVPFGRTVPFAIAGSARSYGATAPYQELGDLSGTVQVDATVLITQAATPHGPFVRVVTGATGRRLVAIASGVLCGAGAVDCDDVVTLELDKAADRASAAVKARP